MEYAQWTIQITLAGVVSLAALVLGLYAKKKHPELAEAAIQNPLKGNGLLQVQDTSVHSPCFIGLTKDDLKEWCEEEQKRILQAISRETEASIHNAINGWKGSTDARLANIENMLNILVSQAMATKL